MDSQKRQRTEEVIESTDAIASSDEEILDEEEDEMPNTIPYGTQVRSHTSLFH